MLSHLWRASPDTLQPLGSLSQSRARQAWRGAAECGTLLLSQRQQRRHADLIAIALIYHTALQVRLGPGLVRLRCSLPKPVAPSQAKHCVIYDLSSF